MNNLPPPKSVIKTGAGADLAFAVVLLASYFAMFSSLPTASPLEITLMILLGIAYIATGIYGYGYCARSNSLALHLAYFAVQIPLGGWIVYLSKSSGFNALILLPLAGHSAMLLSQRWMLAANLAVLGTYIITAGQFLDGWGGVFNTLPTFLAGQIFVIVFVQMALNEEKARQEVERLASELALANQRLREYALQVEELAIAKERNRLAREIHDGLGHYLTTIHMQIQAARAVIGRNPVKAQEMLATAQTQTQEALVDVRASVAALRVGQEDGLPLPEKIHKLIEREGLAPTGLAFTLSGEPCPLSPPAELTLFRAAQEGINNALKHARASSIHILLDYSQPGWVKLTIQDNGVGTDSFEGGFGLIGLKERAVLLDGAFKVTSARGEGFTLEVEVPV
jgi:signal transduction histidine kinase